MFDEVNPLFEGVVNRQAGADRRRCLAGSSAGRPSARRRTPGRWSIRSATSATRWLAENFFNQQNLKRGLLGDITGLQGANREAEMARLGAMSGLSQQDIANRMGGVGMADQVYQSQFLPAERMLGVGAAREAKAGEQLQARHGSATISGSRHPGTGSAPPIRISRGTGGSTQTADHGTANRSVGARSSAAACSPRRCSCRGWHKRQLSAGPGMFT